MLTITSRENPQIKQICGLMSAAKRRRKEGLFVCEGFTLLEEALRRGLQPKAVYCLDSQAHRLPALDCPCALVSQSVLEKISDVPAPQGVVFTLALPEAGKILSGSRFLALDSLRDPGNMGTILRTADAFGLDGVILLGDCVDVYSPKVVRAAMGSLFSTRLYAMTAAQLKEQLDGLGISLYAATLASDSRPVTQLDLKRSCVIIGNEAHGVSPETVACCTGSVIVPIQSAESLNAGVAAGILMWEMRR
ncbi:MAG: RNA methyltransferase [Clostridia bacterium]|nr:RNA methyltransferase [Clostridia bacterium]